MEYSCIINNILHIICYEGKLNQGSLGKAMYTISAILHILCAHTVYLSCIII